MLEVKRRRSKREASQNASMINNLLMDDEFYKTKSKKLANFFNYLNKYQLFICSVTKCVQFICKLLRCWARSLIIPKVNRKESPKNSKQFVILKPWGFQNHC